MSYVVNKPGESMFVRYIKNRISRNKNFVFAILGPTGSGKTYSAISLGKAIDPDFDERNVVFKPHAFMDLISGKSKKLKKGAVVVWDEMQVSMSSLDFQTVLAKSMNFVLQTFRHRNIILIITAPHFTFLNASVRKSFHAILETVKIDFNKNQAVLKPLFIQTNQRTGKSYFKYLKIANGNAMSPLKVVRVPKPGGEFMERYEEMKTAFTSELYNDITETIENMNDDSKTSKKLTDQQRKVLDGLLAGGNIDDVAKSIGFTAHNVRSHKTAMEKKGVKFEAVKHNQKVLRYEVSAYEDLL